MAGDVTLQAGAQLRALFGHIICVAEQDLQLGADGVMQAPAAAAEILLQQEGWTRAEAADEKAEPADDEQAPRRRGRSGT